MDSTNAQAYVASTFQALTDAIVPSDSSHESHLAPDLHVHEYVIDGLNQYITIQQQLFTISIPLAYPTSQILDSAAAQLVNVGKIQPFILPKIASVIIPSANRTL